MGECKVLDGKWQNIAEKKKATADLRKVAEGSVAAATGNSVGKKRWREDNTAENEVGTSSRIQNL